MKSLSSHVIVLGLAMGPFLNACSESSSKVDVGEGDSVAKSEDECFTRLHPGRAKGGKLTNVAYQNGACVQGYQALNKISLQDEVYVAAADTDDLSEASKSPLFLAANGALAVKIDGKSVAVGRYVAKDVNVAINLAEGIEFKLKISDGDAALRDWTLADSMQQRKREAILLIIPSL